MPWPTLAVKVVSSVELTHLLGALPEPGCSSENISGAQATLSVGILPFTWKLSEEHIIPFMTFSERTVSVILEWCFSKPICCLLGHRQAKVNDFIYV